MPSEVKIGPGVCERNIVWHASHKQHGNLNWAFHVFIALSQQITNTKGTAICRVFGFIQELHLNLHPLKSQSCTCYKDDTTCNTWTEQQLKPPVTESSSNLITLLSFREEPNKSGSNDGRSAECWELPTIWQTNHCIASSLAVLPYRQQLSSQWQLSRAKLMAEPQKGWR